MPDPTQPIAGIVQPALFADRLTQLMADAQTCGRRTIEQKIATGRKLLEAKAELDARDQSKTPPTLRLTWEKICKRFGFHHEIARRLMTAATVADENRTNVRPEMRIAPFDADAIYDDGTPIGDKQACRECRMKGKVYDKNCPVCRALNKTVSEPAPEKPLLDMDGQPVPEQLQAAWAEGLLLKDIGEPVREALKTIAGLAQRPGCAALDLKAVRTRLEWAWKYAWKFRPGLPCTPCEGIPGKECGDCLGRGYLTVHQVTNKRAEAKALEKHRKAAGWQERRKRENEPLPE